MSKPSEIYIAVQNFLVNEMGVTKETIGKLVEKRVEEAVDKKIKAILNTSYLERYISAKILERIGNGLRVNPFSSVGRVNFDTFVAGCIKEEVSRMVINKITIDVKNKK